METNSMSRVPDRDEESTIDLLELARVIWGRIWFVVLGFVLGAVMAFSVTKLFITPQYEATATIYIFSKTTSITSLADLQLGSQLAEDFKIIATTRDVVESVITELNLDTNYESLVGRITVTNPNNSHMLRITVRNEDPDTAASISNALSEKLREQIADIMNTDKPSTVQRAVVPTQKSSPNTMRNTELGALIGALLVVAILVIRYLLDDTIKTDDDVRRYLGLDTLAEFPFIKGQTKQVKKPSNRGSRSRQSQRQSAVRTAPRSQPNAASRGRHEAK